MAFVIGIDAGMNMTDARYVLYYERSMAEYVE